MKKVKTNMGKRMKEAVIHVLGGVSLDTDSKLQDSSDVLNEQYLFDFKQGYRSNWGTTGGGGISFDSPVNPDSKEIVHKIVVKPIDVINELQTVPTPFSVNFLDEKISVLQDKAKLIRQRYAKQEVEALIERLEARKQYPKEKVFFDKFQNTTQEKIDELLKKYELEMHPSDIFIPEFPDDAVKIMKEYSAKVKKITGKDTTYYVIAQNELFRKADEKRDPILLVQSPFGFYYQILGAYDKELIALSSL
jgi:hypothetical protein